MNVIDAAKAAGAEFYADTLCVNGKDCHDFIQRFAQIIRNQALEDAAICCDKESLQAVAAWKLAYHPEDQGREIGADNCADAIRSMKKDQTNG